MEYFPNEFCGLWIDEDDRGVYIKKVTSHEFQTTILFNISHQIKNKKYHINEHLKNLITKWILDEMRGVKRLQIEVGVPFTGPTYNLYLSEKEIDIKDFVNIVDKIRLLPEVQMGLYDDWDDDFGIPWAFPYKDYKKASIKLEKEIEKIFSLKKNKS